MIQDFLSHGISIPIGSSTKFTKKLVKILCQNCQIDHVYMVKSVMVTLLLGSQDFYIFETLQTLDCFCGKFLALSSFFFLQNKNQGAQSHEAS